MIVLLVIWLVILTLAIVIGGLMIIGKFARMERETQSLANEVFGEIENLQGGFSDLETEFKNLQTSFQNLRETVEKPSEVSEQVSQIENRIGILQETQFNLKSNVDLLLNADKEHPVLAAPVERSKGGRPRKEG